MALLRTYSLEDTDGPTQPQLQAVQIARSRVQDLHGRRIVMLVRYHLDIAGHIGGADLVHGSIEFTNSGHFGGKPVLAAQGSWQGVVIPDSNVFCGSRHSGIFSTKSSASLGQKWPKCDNLFPEGL